MQEPAVTSIDASRSAHVIVSGDRVRLAGECERVFLRHDEASGNVSVRQPSRMMAVTGGCTNGQGLVFGNCSFRNCTMTFGTIGVRPVASGSGFEEETEPDEGEIELSHDPDGHSFYVPKGGIRLRKVKASTSASVILHPDAVEAGSRDPLAIKVQTSGRVAVPDGHLECSDLILKGHTSGHFQGNGNMRAKRVRAHAHTSSTIDGVCASGAADLKSHTSAYVSVRVARGAALRQKSHTCAMIHVTRY